MRRHGPRKVPGDVNRHKRAVVDEASCENASSTVTTASEATGISFDRTDGTRMSSQHQHQQPFVETSGSSEQWSPSSPKAFENGERQGQLNQHIKPSQWHGPLTPESIGRPPVGKTDGSTSLPSPQSRRSVYGSPDALEPPQPRPAMSLPQNSGWTSQQSEHVWSQEPGRPTPTPIRSGVSLFQRPEHQIAHPGMNPRVAPLPQSPQSNIRLDDQMEALREHIASQQRPIGPTFGGPVPTPSSYWPQMHPSSPQAQRAFPHNNTPTLRSLRPPQSNIPSLASPTPTFPDLTKTTLEGYEFLAAKLTDGSIGARPMYRSFEHLHHRLLLYLQDEICEYEEELRNLDEWISQVGLVVSEGKAKPASRRAEARITPTDSELMFRRKFVLGEIFVKLERYREFLCVLAW
jgi:hypothetical protein